MFLLVQIAGAVSIFAAAPQITNPPAPQTIFLGDPVTFTVGAAGTLPLTYQWLRNGQQVNGATNLSLSFVTTSADHAQLFSVRVANSSGAVTSAPALLAIDFGVPGDWQTNRLIQMTNVWRYNARNIDLGSGWRSSTYDDTAWDSGGGLLYVEDGALPEAKTTPLLLIPGKLPITCYFRTHFTNAQINAFTLNLVGSAVVDDGVVIYLNGQEVSRRGMPAGAIEFTNFATRVVGNAVVEGPLSFSSTSLAPGTNFIATEVHQNASNSTDVVFGLSLDAAWRPRWRDSNAPVMVNITPPAASSILSLTEIEVLFDEGVRGVNAADLLINGAPARNLIALASNSYRFEFNAPAPGNVNVSWAANHGITDLSYRSNAFGGGAWTYTVNMDYTPAQLSFAEVIQSSDDSTNTAIRAVDGKATTFSLTQDKPGSFWQARLGRAHPVQRIEIVNRTGAEAEELAGQVLRLYNLDDQQVFQTNLVNPGSGATLEIVVPTNITARSVWIGLPGSQVNGAGNQCVGLAEVRLFGDARSPYGPPTFLATQGGVQVWQSSEYGGYPASNALDGNPSTFTHTGTLPDGCWMADLGTNRLITRVEVVNRADACCHARMAGLVLRILNATSNSVASVTLTNPGAGGTFVFTPPPNTTGRTVKIGLENGLTNGAGDYYVTLAELRAFSGSTNWFAASSPLPPAVNNLASFKPSYMLRLDDSLPPAGNANDNNTGTEARTTLRTVDGYWEVDLGSTYALYGVRAIAASGIGFRLTNTVVRLFDAAHESVDARKLSGTADTFDHDLNGPVFARYVRIGLEDKQRTDPAGGIEFYIGFREVEVFGRPTNGVGVVTFEASTNQVAPGQGVNLAWTVDDVQRVEIYPGIGSVGAYTGVDGTGRLAVQPTNSTECILVATNPAGIFTRAASVLVGNAPLHPRISELVAENRHSLKDGYGDSPDWIEIRNPSDVAADLTGWGLSDDPAFPMKWVFPTTTLAAHGSLVIFASGRDTTRDPQGNLHANFTLSKAGGGLFLNRANGTTVDSIAGYPELDRDLAYGRSLEGQWTFIEPTPGSPNVAPTYQGWVKPVDWSHTRGFYDAPFTLAVTNNSPGATLLYSVDGGLPVLPLTSSLAIAGTTSVRVQTVRPGFKPARIQTKTFVFVDSVITSPVMNTTITQDPAYASRLRAGLLALPSVSICVPGTQPEYEEVEGSLEVLWPGGQDGVQVNCGIQRFGNAWTKFAKRSFRMKCRARYGDSKLEVPLFNGFDRGVLVKSSFDELDLRSGSQDMVERGFYMAGRFVEDSMLDMGSLNPHGRFVHVYLNGVYWGQYDCRELLVEHFMADYLGGASEDYVAVRGNDNVSDDFVPGTPEPPNRYPWDRVLALKSSYLSVRPYVDVPHMIDFWLLWNYGNCESEYRSCGPLEAGTGFKFWIADADGFLRTSAMGLNRTSRTGPGGIFGALVAENHPDFKALLADRIYRHFFNNGSLTPLALDARLVERLAEVRNSMILECARWNYRTPLSWESAAAAVRSNLFPGRTSQLLGYLRNAGLYPAFDPPVFNQFGGLVTNGFQPVVTSTQGTIYYTLDGSDPRAPGGGISSEALVWTPGAVTITADLTLHFRVRTAAGAWSALAQPHFLIASRRQPSAKDLLITEINYNPPGPDDYEFVELYNASTSWLDLSGVSLSNAVRFVFPNATGLAPGAFVVVVENAAAFDQRYQAAGSPYYSPGTRVAGEWTGALDNAGESLSLVASNGVPLATINYGSGGDWPERADGKGSSLELSALPRVVEDDDGVRAYVSQGRNWSSSSLYHGSPGRFDAFAKSVRINELLSHTDEEVDWLELRNYGPVAVNLSGCTLSDNMDSPAPWTFPANSILQSGQFLWLSSTTLGFSFSELGEQAYLLEVSGTNVIRFLDTVDFPAVAREEPFGLYSGSDGEFRFTELRARTPNAPNALPRVGPVAISEIMFLPGTNRAQFIELVNLGPVPVPLYDPEHPTNAWKIEGLGNYFFPTGILMQSCATLIVCATNPAMFRAQYNLSSAQAVLGPWTGALQKDGETLRLLQPGAPELDGFVPYYRVDHVSYRTNPPWSPAVPGHSLERTPVSSFGNDPGSWQPGVPGGTPGVASANRAPVVAFQGATAVQQFAEMTLTFSVADPDVPWQAVDLTVTHMPAGARFDPVLRTFHWTPSTQHPPGNYLLQVQASDNAGCHRQTAILDVPLTVGEAWSISGQYSPADGFSLSFPAVGGQTYLIQFRDDLASGDWQVLREITPPESGVVTIADPGQPATRARFYRVWCRNE